MTLDAEQLWLNFLQGNFTVLNAEWKEDLPQNIKAKITVQPNASISLEFAPLSSFYENRSLTVVVLMAFKMSL